MKKITRFKYKVKSKEHIEVVVKPIKISGHVVGSVAPGNMSWKTGPAEVIFSFEVSAAVGKTHFVNLGFDFPTGSDPNSVYKVRTKGSNGGNFVVDTVSYNKNGAEMTIRYRVV